MQEKTTSRKFIPVSASDKTVKWPSKPLPNLMREVDGECLRLHDWESVRVNLLRALTIRNTATQFYLFSDADLTPFHLSRPNLILVPRELNSENVEEEIWENLATKETFWLKAHSAN
jgi:hypothetical protein